MSQSAEPLVLLPGMMCDERLFDHQMAALAKQREVLYFPLTGADSIPALAQQVITQAPPKFALAGLSMGGIVAMEIVRQASARVSRLVLMDTNPHAEQPERQLVRERQVRAAQNGQLKAIMRDEMKPNYLAKGADQQRVLKLCMTMAESLGVSAFVQQSNALKTRASQLDTLVAIDIPTLIVCGAEDSLCPPQQHQRMHSLVRDSVLEIIPGAGHLPTLEQASVTTELLREWLGERPG